MCEVFPRTKPGQYNPLDTSLLRNSLKSILNQELPPEIELLTLRLQNAEKKAREDTNQ